MSVHRMVKEVFRHDTIADNEGFEMLAVSCYHANPDSFSWIRRELPKIRFPKAEERT